MHLRNPQNRKHVTASASPPTSSDVLITVDSFWGLSVCIRHTLKPWGALCHKRWLKGKRKGREAGEGDHGKWAKVHHFKNFPSFQLLQRIYISFYLAFIFKSWNVNVDLKCLRSQKKEKIRKDGNSITTWMYYRCFQHSWLADRLVPYVPVPALLSEVIFASGFPEDLLQRCVGSLTFLLIFLCLQTSGPP